jgi:hypothetical protein
LSRGRRRTGRFLQTFNPEHEPEIITTLVLITGLGIADSGNNAKKQQLRWLGAHASPQIPLAPRGRRLGDSPSKHASQM